MDPALMHAITAIEMVSSVDNGRYKRFLQILGEKLPPLYIKYGQDIFDEDIKFTDHMKEVINVRKMLYTLDDLFYDDFGFIMDEMLQYVEPDDGGTPTYEKVFIVDILTDILNIDRFNTILDIGASSGDFLAHTITNELTKHGIAVDIVDPEKWFFLQISLNSQVLPRIEYRHCDGLTQDFALPKNSLVTSFYLNCDPTENAKNVVDVAISNNAPFIMFYRNLDEIVDYAWECGMERVDVGDPQEGVFV